MKIVIPISDEQKEVLNRQINGTGGWQSLMRRIQSGISGNKLAVDINDLKTIRGYKEGQGGWQGRLNAIIPQLKSVKRELRGY